jgi:hypothetical protein
MDRVPYRCVARSGGRMLGSRPSGLRRRVAPKVVRLLEDTDPDLLAFLDSPPSTAATFARQTHLSASTARLPVVPTAIRSWISTERWSSEAAVRIVPAALAGGSRHAWRAQLRLQQHGVAAALFRPARESTSSGFTCGTGRRRAPVCVRPRTSREQPHVPMPRSERTHRPATFPPWLAGDHAVFRTSVARTRFPL